MKLVHAILGALVLLTAVARAGPITLIDTLGSSNSFTTAAPYTIQTGNSPSEFHAFAFQFTVTQATIIDEVKAAGQGELQLRFATNSGGNLPTTPLLGGVGVTVNGLADVTGNFGTLLPGTYWVEYLTSFTGPSLNDIFKNDQNLSGLIAFNTTVDQSGVIDQTAWQSQTGLLPAIALYGHVVPEPTSLAMFGTALTALGILKRRKRRIQSQSVRCCDMRSL